MKILFPITTVQDRSLFCIDRTLYLLSFTGPPTAFHLDLIWYSASENTVSRHGLCVVPSNFQSLKLHYTLDLNRITLYLSFCFLKVYWNDCGQQRCWYWYTSHVGGGWGSPLVSNRTRPKGDLQSLLRWSALCLPHSRRSAIRIWEKWPWSVGGRYLQWPANFRSTAS